jgi:hypothetical protein
MLPLTLWIKPWLLTSRFWIIVVRKFALRFVWLYVFDETGDFSLLKRPSFIMHEKAILYVNWHYPVFMCNNHFLICN